VGRGKQSETLFMNNLIKSQMSDFRRQFQHLHMAALNDEHFKMAIPHPL
jgi:hypothetical protein